MTKILKHILPILLCAALVPTGIASVSAKETDDGIFLNAIFDNQATNEVNITDVSVAGGKVIVEETGAKNKALHLQKAETDAVITGAFESNGEKYITYSFDVKSADANGVNLKISLSATADGKNPVNILNIQNNEIRTIDNKFIGGIGADFTTVAFTVKDKYLFDAYIEGKCVLSDWKMPSEFDASSLVLSQVSGFESYIDNIRIYKGSKVRKSGEFQSMGYNTEKYDNILMESAAGDTTFFDNRFPVTDGGVGKYSKMYTSPKTNKITCTRLNDMKSTNRTNYIYMERTDPSNDCYFDVNCTGSSLNYSYYKMEGDFRIDKLGSIIQFPMIRDTVTSGSAVSAFPFQISADGSITFSGGSAAKVIQEGKQFHFLAFFNTKTNTADAWLDGVRIAKNIPFADTIKQITLMRVSLAGGSTGNLWLDNFDITGLVQPITDGVDVKTSILPSEEPIKEFLKDKIAYGHYGNILYKNNNKIELSKKGIYDKENVKFYVPAETLAEAFDLNLTSENGKISGDAEITSDGNVILKDGKSFKLSDEVKKKDGVLYVPFAEFGEAVTGLKAWTMETGIIVFADHKLNFKTEDWEYPVFRSSIWNNFDYLSGFLNYVHPDTNRLREDYIAHTGEVTSTQHPRLILNSDDFAEHKRHFEAGDDEYYSKLAKTIISKADNYLTSEMAHYTFADPVRGSFYGFLERFMAWGYAYNITGDQKYVDAAVEQFRIIDEEMPDFNEAHILDSGLALRGVAIGFDWLYNGFTDEQRTRYANMIFKKGIEPLGDGLYGRLPQGSFGMSGTKFITRDNINGICNAGVMDACIALMEYAPEDCMAYLSESIRSLEYAMSLLEPDGGWVESPSYWEFMMQSVIWGTSALERSFGSSYGLMDGQGMENTINWALATFGNTTNNCYGDGLPVAQKSYTAFNYFGKRNDDRAAIYSRKRDIERRGDNFIDYNDIVFYDFNNNDASADDMKKISNLVRVNGVEMATIRDTFDFDTSNIFFSTHFGTTSGYHQHTDCGSFVLDLMGERWADDYGQDDYNLENVNGYKDWQLYRKRAEGHNVMVINPAGHTKDFEMRRGQKAEIVTSDANEYGGYVYADMSDVYTEASKMTLGYYVDDNMNSVTMRNEFTLNNDNDIYWFLQTPAKAIVSGKTVFLEKNGKSVKLEFLSSSDDAEWEVTDAKPLSTSPQVAEQNPNIGYSRVALKLKGKQGDNKLVVKISPTSYPTKQIEDVPISKWTLPEKSELSDAQSFDTSFDVYADDKPVKQDTVVVLDDIMPKITVNAKQNDAIVEIAEAKDVDSTTAISVWSPDRKTCALKLITYKSVKTGLTSVEGYVDLPIISTEVSQTPEAANHKENMTDYDFGTRWTCMAKGATAIFDLGESKKVDAVAAAFWKGNVRSYYYDIYTSEDGENWSPARIGMSSSGTSEELELCEFGAPVTARYIKYVGNGNSVANAETAVNSNVLEFRILEKAK